MLHAFNQKHARRILLARADEHDIGKAEDAATSMVFSPLAFMTAEQALKCLLAVLDRAALAEVNGREPIGHRLELWPQGLVARSKDDMARLSRCEPDLVATFDFAEGPSVAFIGEMKWDWFMTQEALSTELGREREAVRRSNAAARQVVFVVSKRRYQPISGVAMLTWPDFAGRLALLERRDPASPSSIWAGLVRTFLAVADQHTFTGLPSIPLEPEWSKRPAFWDPQ